VGPFDSKLLVNIGQNVHRAKERNVIQHAWGAVARNASGISLLRIDGLIWQVGDVIYDNWKHRATAIRVVASKLRKFGTPDAIAERVATELTYALR
jgi:hypothetical protein